MFYYTGIPIITYATAVIRDSTISDDTADEQNSQMIQLYPVWSSIRTIHHGKRHIGD